MNKENKTLSDALLVLLNDYEKGNVSSIKFSMDATLVNEKLKELELKNEKLMAENSNLKNIIAKELSENDEFGAEFVIVNILKEKLKELELKNEKLMAREEIYKSIIKKQAEVLEHYKHDFDHDPSEDEIEKDYDCGCCSVGATGARAFVVLKEVSKMMEEIEGEK